MSPGSCELRSVLGQQIRRQSGVLVIKFKYRKPPLYPALVTFILRTVNKQIKTRFSLRVLGVLRLISRASTTKGADDDGRQVGKKALGSSTCLSKMSQRTRHSSPQQSAFVSGKTLLRICKYP